MFGRITFDALYRLVFEGDNLLPQKTLSNNIPDEVTTKGQKHYPAIFARSILGADLFKVVFHKADPVDGSPRCQRKNLAGEYEDCYCPSKHTLDYICQCITTKGSFRSNKNKPLIAAYFSDDERIARTMEYIQEQLTVFLKKLPDTEKYSSFLNIRLPKYFKINNQNCFTPIDTKATTEAQLKQQAKWLSRMAMISTCSDFWNTLDLNRMDEPARQMVRVVYPELINLINPTAAVSATPASIVEWELCEAERALNEAVSGQAGSYDVCKTKCENVIGKKPSPVDNDIARANWLLYRCAAAGNTGLQFDHSADHYLSEAIRHAQCSSHVAWYADALAEFKRKKPDSLVWKPETAGGSISSDSTSCIYFAAEENDRLAMLRRFLSKTDQVILWDGNEETIQPVILDALGSSSGRLFLNAEDPEKNIRYLLTFLQFIKGKDRAPIEGTYRPCKYRISIFIRGDEEALSPIIDTALSRMGSIYLPVCILDEDKLTVQNLLTCHPLFYSLRKLSRDDKYTMNTILIGGTRGTEWALRESYWLSQFFCSDKSSGHIHVYSPNDCVVKAIRSIFRTDFADNRVHHENLNRLTLFDSLRELLSKNPYHNYFVIDTGSDTENLSLAIRLRELTIECALKCAIDEPNNNFSLNELPVIAFRCSDPDAAQVARFTVVQSEAYGGSWYNNYRLLPFGSLADIYTPENLTGGILEEIALCVHLNYCWVRPEDPANDSYHKALYEYYTRTYNRDSSRTVAMSLPYRLFSTCPLHDRVVSSQWDILDNLEFSGKKNLDRYAAQFEAALKLGAETDKLSRLEHDRWWRYMETRGWKSCDLNTAIAYIRGGNKRQQLYIAKIHACMRPYDELEELSQSLFDSAQLATDSGKRKDFLGLDIDNVKNTANFLRQETRENWLRKKPAETAAE